MISLQRLVGVLALSSAVLGGVGMVGIALTSKLALADEVEVEVQVAPPPVRVETIPPAPSAQHFWIHGYWGWQGGGHVWVPGRWEVMRPGWAWEEARWAEVGPRWHFYPGHWARR